MDFGRPVGKEQGYRRPAVVVSDDRLNAGPGGVVVLVPFTTAHRGLPLHVEVEAGTSGLTQVSYAKCEDIKSVAIERMVRRLGEVDISVMFAIQQVLRRLFRL